MNISKQTTSSNYIRISGPPVEVGVTMYVLSISSLSEVKMVHSLSVPLYIYTYAYIYI